MVWTVAALLGQQPMGKEEAATVGNLELLHEEFGDGIMSAINFKLDVERRPVPGG